MRQDLETRDAGHGTRLLSDTVRVSSLTYRDVANAEVVRNTLRHASRFSIVAIAACLLAGCGNIEPWVMPYERAALAESIMMPSRHPVADDFLLHVYEVREAARGASGSAGGGCGCN